MLFADQWSTSALGVVISSFLLSACSQTDALTSAADTSGKRSYGYSMKDRECLARAMFFESKRSSRDGLVAVGTVVMNRLRSKRHGDTICKVVGEKGQFAPGVLSRPMNSKALPDVQEAADAVLKGERHPRVKNAMFFHQAGLKFPYKNMHYVLVAGGNAFYEKRSRGKVILPPEEPSTAVASVKPEIDDTVVASIPPAASPNSTQVADAEQPAMSFEASQEDADAIGALIAGQVRP
ncbi:MAG TPA: cell wall hydrolase [Rhizobiaceae bacterium]|nr:cell wall hydrolase [Rhizobiaceae bacterium]